MGNVQEDGTRMHIPRRGVDIIVRRGQLTKDQLEAKMELVAQSGTLRRRYPNSESGVAFMQHVDPEWGETLLKHATKLTDDIVLAWNDISPGKPIAVILYGSIARGLVKNPKHCDPSNIDLGVIGDISDEERDKLFDAIRPSRQSIQTRILENCPNINTHEHNPGNAGVQIQNINKLKKNGYHSTLYWYITADAYALYDPATVWGQLESEALDHYIATKKKRKPIEYVIYEAGASESATQQGSFGAGTM